MSGPMAAGAPPGYGGLRRPSEPFYVPRHLSVPDSARAPCRARLPCRWVLHPSKDFGGLVLNGFVRTTKLGMQALKAVYAEEYAPILAWVPALRRRHKWLLQELFRPPLTLTHGDAHIENVFFHR